MDCPDCDSNLHKDRNRKNSEITNLQILCPTCHAEEHYKSRDGLFHNNS